MFTRRQWMETAAAWSAWPALRPAASIATLPSAGSVDDEAFSATSRALMIASNAAVHCQRRLRARAELLWNHGSA